MMYLTRSGVGPHIKGVRCRQPGMTQASVVDSTARPIGHTMTTLPIYLFIQNVRKGKKIYLIVILKSPLLSLDKNTDRNTYPV